MSAPLGWAQHLVLMLLARGDAKSVVDLAYDHPALSESTVRGAIRGLARRKLVDVAGFDGRARTFALTKQGEVFEANLTLRDVSIDGEQDS